MAFADVPITLFAILVVAFLFLTDVEGAADAADDTGAEPSGAAVNFTTSCKLMRPVSLIRTLAKKSDSAVSLTESVVALPGLMATSTPRRLNAFELRNSLLIFKSPAITDVTGPERTFGELATAGALAATAGALATAGASAAVPCPVGSVCPVN